MKLNEINLSLITIKARQRKELSSTEDSMEDFKNSIKERGLIHPIAVAETKGEKYILIAGARRLIAMKELGEKVIPAHIYPTGLTEDEHLAIEIEENKRRKDFTVKEDVLATKALHDLMIRMKGKKRTGPIPKDATPEERKKLEESWSNKKTARMLGVSEASVQKDLQMAEAMELMPELKTAKTKLEVDKKLSQILDGAQIDELRRDEFPNELRELLIAQFSLKSFEDVSEKLKDGVANLITAESLDIDTEFCNKCKKLLYPNGWLLIFLRPEELIRKPNHSNVFDALEETNFTLMQNPGIWLKGIRKDTAPQTFAANVEFFIVAFTGAPVMAVEGRSQIFPFTPIQPQHNPRIGERPIELYEELIKTFIHRDSPKFYGRLLIPFVRDGNILLAAANLRVPAFGYSIKGLEKVREHFVNQINKSAPPNYISNPQSKL